MAAAVSVGTMLKQIAGLADTIDLSDWENIFVKRMVRITDTGNRTSMLSSEQVEKIAEIWEEHFSG